MREKSHKIVSLWLDFKGAENTYVLRSFCFVKMPQSLDKILFSRYNTENCERGAHMVLTVTISNRILSFAIFEKGKDPRDAIPVATVSLAAQAPRTADEYAALLGATFSQ